MFKWLIILHSTGIAVTRKQHGRFKKEEVREPFRGNFGQRSTDIRLTPHIASTVNVTEMGSRVRQSKAVESVLPGSAVARITAFGPKKAGISGRSTRSAGVRFRGPKGSRPQAPSEIIFTERKVVCGSF